MELTEKATAIFLNREANIAITAAFVQQSFALAATPGVDVEAITLLADLEDAIEAIENYVFRLTGAKVWMRPELDGEL